MVVSAKEGERIISAHDSLWTMVRIPLGTSHEVRPVVGVRMSFVRGVFSEKESDYRQNGKEVEAILMD